jgi:hypothetical protein
MTVEREGELKAKVQIAEQKAEDAVAALGTEKEASAGFKHELMAAMQDAATLKVRLKVNIACLLFCHARQVCVRVWQAAVLITLKRQWLAGGR